MKKLLLLPILFFAFACGNKESQNEKANSSLVNSEEPSEKKELDIKTDKTFGKNFESLQAKTKSEMLQLYEGLSVGDTVQVQFQSEVKSVCAKKGCWMKLNLNDELQSHVTFKDYGFFVPKNSKGHRMQVNGIAFIEMTDVETLRHYAEDAGKSESEIAEIIEPQLNFRFIADGAKAVQ